MPLGGQHISAALYTLWQSMGGKRDSDAQIPDEIKFVDAELLKHNTPKELCRLAAGEHQAHQKDVEGASTSDVFSYFYLMATEKMNSDLATPFMSDNEIFIHCRSLGLQKFTDKYGKELTDKQQVHRFIVTTCRRTFHLFYYSENHTGSAVETSGILGKLLQ